MSKRTLIEGCGEFSLTVRNMPIRDWFAGMALMGNLASNAIGYEYTGEDAHVKASYEAYKLADAMLAARDQQAEQSSDAPAVMLAALKKGASGGVDGPMLLEYAADMLMRIGGEDYPTCKALRDKAESERVAINRGERKDPS